MNPTEAHILVVEDQHDIADFVQNALQHAGWAVRVAGNMAQARGCLQHILGDATAAPLFQPQLMLLDLGLPDGDGIDLIAAVRAVNPLPIIVLSARHQEIDKIKALDAGADDYLTKPFSINELLARVRAQLRRLQPPPTLEAEPIVRFGAVVLDRQKQRVTRDGEPIHLTQTEYQLLCHLVAHAGMVLTQRQLLQQVWGGHLIEQAHYLRIYMSHLRKKLEDNPAQPKFLLTETGVGYRFVGQ